LIANGVNRPTLPDSALKEKLVRLNIETSKKVASPLQRLQVNESEAKPMKLLYSKPISPQA
jgi:hypothetical protein